MSWRLVPLKRACTAISRGSAPTYAASGDPGVAAVIGQSCQRPDGTLDLSLARRHASGAAVPEKGRVFGGDVLINSTGTGTLGRVAMLRDAPAPLTFVDTHVTLLRAHRDRTEPRFLTYSLGRRASRLFIEEALSVGATKQRELATEALRSHSVWLPPVDVQRDLADFLDCECERIAELSVALAAVPARVAAELDARLEETLDGAALVSIKYLGYTVEQGWSPESEDRPPEDDEVGVLRLSSVSSGRFMPRHAKALRASAVSASELDRFGLLQGDVLLVRASGSLHLLGATCLVDVLPARPLLFPDIVYRLRAKAGRAPLLPPRLVCALIGSARGRRGIELAKRGAANNKLRIEDVRSLRIPVPPEDQVPALLDLLVDGERRSVEAKRLAGSMDKSLIEYRDALITEAVTGKLDVTTLSDAQLDESAHAALEGETPEVLAS